MNLEEDLIDCNRCKLVRFEALASWNRVSGLLIGQNGLKSMKFKLF